MLSNLPLLLLTVGVLGALGVGQYPRLPCRHPDNQSQLRCCDQCLHPPGIHPRVAGQRAAPPPADHAHQRVAALLRDHEGAARVTLARVLAGVSSADVHAECMWIVDSRL